MFNDDPYKLQRVKPQQGAVGGAPVAPVATRTPQPIGGAQQTLAQTPSMAAGLTRPGIQSTVSAFQSPLAQQPASMTHAPRPGVNFSPPALAWDGMVRKPDGYVSALDPSNKSMLTATAPMPSGARRTGGRPDLKRRTGGRPDLKQTAGATLAATPVGAPQSTVIGFTGDGLSGKANAAAPGQVALSEMRSPIQQGFTQINSGFYRTPTGATLAGQAPTSGAAVGGRPLPGAPLVGADGSVQYDQAWADKNKALIAGYAEKNVMPMGVPGPGVAASMVTGGNMPSGPLTRPPQGFSAADRATQLDSMDRQSQQYAARTLNERAVRAASYGNADAGALQEAAAAASLAQPPRIQPLQRPDPNDAARLSMEQQRLGMDQQQAGLVAEQTKLGTQSQQLQLKQAQQMQALSEQLMSGTPEQKQAAAASLAALQNTKPGDPVKVKRKMPTGQVDALGQPVMGEEEVLYNPQTGQWMAPPAAGGAGGKQLPAGVTPQNAIADAQAAIAAGASRDAIAAELAQYGISL